MISISANHIAPSAIPATSGDSVVTRMTRSEQMSSLHICKASQSLNNALKQLGTNGTAQQKDTSDSSGSVRNPDGEDPADMEENEFWSKLPKGDIRPQTMADIDSLTQALIERL